MFLRELNEKTDKHCQDRSDCNAVNAEVGVQYFH